MRKLLFGPTFYKPPGPPRAIFRLSLPTTIRLQVKNNATQYPLRDARAMMARSASATAVEARAVGRENIHTAGTRRGYDASARVPSNPGPGAAGACLRLLSIPALQAAHRECRSARQSSRGLKRKTPAPANTHERDPSWNRRRKHS